MNGERFNNADIERGMFNNVDAAVDSHRALESLDAGFDSYEAASYENEQYIDSVMAEAFEDVAKNFRQRIERRKSRRAGETALGNIDSRRETSQDRGAESAESTVAGSETKNA